MKKIKKILTILTFGLIATFMFKGIYAASASISASKKTVTQGETVKITVNYNAAAWNLHVSGDASGSIVGYDPEGENKSGSKSYTVKASKVGTYTVYLTGDVTDANTGTTLKINKSVTITSKEKQVEEKKTTTETKDTKTVKTKSSDANIKKLSLNVEGFSFNSKDTKYTVNVQENVTKLTIGVTLSSSKAVYYITGNKNFKVGNNTVKIVVTAENGKTKTYTINVIKSGNVEESSADLSNLIIEDMTFSEPFNSSITEYTGKIKYTEKLNILTYTVSEKATCEIIGNEKLKVGLNTITIKVTSKDKTNTKEYKVNFEMLSNEESDAFQNVSVYSEKAKEKVSKGKNYFFETVKANSTIILLYLLCLVEFGQVVYLYIELKKVNPDTDTLKRRKTK